MRLDGREGEGAEYGSVGLDADEGHHVLATLLRLGKTFALDLFSLHRRCNSNFSHLFALIRIVFLYIGNKHVRLSFISLRLGDCLSGGEHPQDAKFRFNFRGCKRLKIERLLAINVSISYIYIFVIIFQINF